MVSYKSRWPSQLLSTSAWLILHLYESGEVLSKRSTFCLIVKLWSIWKCFHLTMCWWKSFLQKLKSKIYELSCLSPLTFWAHPLGSTLFRTLANIRSAQEKSQYPLFGASAVGKEAKITSNVILVVVCLRGRVATRKRIMVIAKTYLRSELLHCLPHFWQLAYQKMIPLGYDTYVLTLLVCSKEKLKLLEPLTVVYCI